MQQFITAVSHHRNSISIADIKGNANSPALSIGKRSLDLINKASNGLKVFFFFPSFFGLFLLSCFPRL